MKLKSLHEVEEIIYEVNDAKQQNPRALAQGSLLWVSKWNVYRKNVESEI